MRLILGILFLCLPIGHIGSLKVDNHICLKQEGGVNSPAQLFSLLQKNLIPDADILTCIAVAESGYDLSNRIGKNNIFGISNICYIHYHFTTVKGKLGQEYIDFDTMEDQIKFIELWIYANPRFFNEDKVNYIYRTGYNPYPAYYTLLRQLYNQKIWENAN